MELHGRIDPYLSRQRGGLTMAEIEFEGATYRLASLDPMSQFHITRRIAPAMAAFQKGVAEIGDGEASGAIMASIMSALGELSDADAEYVIGRCLAECRRKNGEAWAKVWAGGRLMFDDIQMPGMIRLTFETIRENMADFFPGRSLSSPSAAA
ncbi:hypothetical protein C8K11_12057 [Novosphingobium sp. GV055]|nr:hypothetical protein C8K11_12057 [Novosphingobium sp. GV055]PUB13788.1 hypothetical protein C8K14_12057 [Novosphingobium sp. GV079]PUB38486.1 hypothetical protein C8K10_12057 [Novosphingobium sp. GV027]